MSTRYAGRPVKVLHDGLHFKLVLKYDPETRETTRAWVWAKEKVLDLDTHLVMPKPRSSGEKFPIIPDATKPDSTERFAPARGAVRMQSRETPAVGTRYCQQIHAFVPENLPYRVSGLAPEPKARLAERLLTGEFWHLPFAGEDDEQASVGLDIRVVPAKDGSAVHAEGLTHHQAKLIPLREAQKDSRIKYRAVTQVRRDELVALNYAQTENKIKYFNLSALF